MMSISNSANNSFKLGPGLDLIDTYLTVDGYHNRTTKIDCSAVTAITIEILPPSEKINHSFDIFSDPTLHSLHSSIKIMARGDFGEEALLLKTLITKSGSAKQIQSMKPEFNHRHELAVELSKAVHQNIDYAWRTTREKGDIDQTILLTDRFDELTALTALTIRPDVPFHDDRAWILRKLNPFNPKI